MMMVISATCRAMIGSPEFPMIQRSFRALIYYNCLLTFCFHELDVLIENDDLLLNVHALKRFQFTTSLLEIAQLMSCQRKMPMLGPDFKSISSVY
jgi:hypothetical protein